MTTTAAFVTSFVVGTTVAEGNLESPIAGLGPVEVAIGDQRINLELSKAKQIQVTPVVGIRPA